MSNPYDQLWNTHSPPTTSTRTTSDPPSNPQYGAPALNAVSTSPYPPRSVVNAAPVSHGHGLSQRPPTSPTAPTTSNPTGSALYGYRSHQSEERSLTGLGYHFSAPEIQDWPPADNGGNINEGHLPPTLLQGQFQGRNDNQAPRPSRQSYQRRNPPSPPSPSPPPPNVAYGGDTSQKNCIIPDCPYPAYYNYADQEQTEYCGQGHELHAIATGLVDTCVMCKGRPRLTGERVCGRICKERAREAHLIRGSYYGVQVTRYEPQTRSGP